MKHITHILFIAISLFAIGACNSGTSGSGSNETAAAESFQKMTTEMMMELFSQVDAVDVTFYDAPVSMSSTDQNVRSFLAFVSPEGITERFKTKSDGAMMYLSNGDIISEIEFYLNPDGSGGYAQVGYKGEKYYHTISPNGANFLMQPINQMKAGTLQRQ